MWLILLANIFLSGLGALICSNLIKEYIPIFIQRRMYGNDQCKVSNAPVPEPMGVICAAVYLIVMFIFIPFPFLAWVGEETDFPYTKLLAFLSGLISICTAILLGFADDVLDLRWRHKLLFPTLSSLPLLMVYYVSGSSTTVIIPGIARNLFHHVIPSSFIELPISVNISGLYYLFMGMVVVFCTNAINILAGVNGLESGQSLVMAGSVIVFNIIQIIRMEMYWNNLLSLYFLIPFFACTFVLYLFNKYPARVFVGDTFCYWAGMTLAVVSILGHFSKTMILFMIPQVLNFIYSIPQLFHMVPCPRHRLPKFDPESDTLNMSMAEFKLSDLKTSGKLVLAIFKTVGLLHRRDFEKDGEMYVEINNLTVLNLVLLYAGPMHEKKFTNTLLSLQGPILGQSLRLEEERRRTDEPNSPNGRAFEEAKEDQQGKKMKNPKIPIVSAAPPVLRTWRITTEGLVEVAANSPMGAFLDKPITKKINDSGEGNNVRYGLACMQGWRVDMEDAHVVQYSMADQDPFKDWSFFAVFDGHAGKLAADEAAENIKKTLIDTPQFDKVTKGLLETNGVLTPALIDLLKEGIRDGFLLLDDFIRKQLESDRDRSGCTAVCSIITPTHLIIANLGDSRAVVSRENEEPFGTVDHKPYHDKEKDRIIGAGGSVMIQRINGSLAVSRAFGDFEYKNSPELKPEKQLVSPEPDVYVLERKKTDKYMVVACDGIYDVMNNQELCDFVDGRLVVQENLEHVCNDVLDACLSKGSRDNMTMIIVCFEGSPKVDTDKQQEENAWKEKLEQVVREIVQEDMGKDGFHVDDEMSIDTILRQIANRGDVGSVGYDHIKRNVVIKVLQDKNIKHY